MMLHPSYSDLMKVVNKDSDSGNTPVVNSRYSIVMATAKRARQIIARQSHDELKEFKVSKPLSRAVDELYSGQMKILPGEEDADTVPLTDAEEPLDESAEAEPEEETETEPED